MKNIKAIVLFFVLTFIVSCNEDKATSMNDFAKADKKKLNEDSYYSERETSGEEISITYNNKSYKVAVLCHIKHGNIFKNANLDSVVIDSLKILNLFELVSGESSIQFKSNAGLSGMANVENYYYKRRNYPLSIPHLSSIFLNSEAILHGKHSEYKGTKENLFSEGIIFIKGNLKDKTDAQVRKIVEEEFLAHVEEYKRRFSNGSTYRVFHLVRHPYEY